VKALPDAPGDSVYIVIGPMRTLEQTRITMQLLIRYLGTQTAWCGLAATLRDGKTTNWPVRHPKEADVRNTLAPAYDSPSPIDLSNTDASPALCLVLTPDLTIAAVSNAYIFEVFPDDLKAAQDAAKRDGEPVPMALPASTPVFTVPTALASILDRDLVAAGIAKRDGRGWTVDVHALRTTFGTLLSKGGVPLRTAQAAMRHSDPSLTANVYYTYRDCWTWPGH